MTRGMSAGARMLPALAVPLVLAALTLAGCGAADESRAGTTALATPSLPSTSAPAQNEPGTTTSAPKPARAVPAVLRFEATTVDGKPFRGADLVGHRTVLWFWAPWCTVCARAAPQVRQAASELGPDVQVVGVAGLSSDAAGMRRFVQRGDLQGLTHLADTTGDLYTRFGVDQQDTYIFVRPDGSVASYPGYSREVDIVGLAGRIFG